MGRYLTRWLIPLPAILFAIWPTIVKADSQPGLHAVGYTINQIPPTKSDTVYSTCGSEIENNINRNFNYEPFQQCGDDNFMVHYRGFITIPENNTIQFMVAADDGGTVKIGLEEFGTWNDKGCSWSRQTSVPFEAGIYPFDGWFYEHGGGTCYMLAWRINLGQWEIVPDSAFTTNNVAVTTTSSTSTTTTTTTPATSTTLEESTTSSSTTTLPQETTTTTSTIPEVSTTQTTSTTTTTTTTIPPTTTTVEPYTPPQTTTTVFIEPPTTTTSLVATTSTTEEPTTTTTSLSEPETTVEETSTTTDPPDPGPTVPESVPTLPVSVPTLPDDTTPQTSQPSSETSMQETSTTEAQSSSTTTLPDIQTAIDEFVNELEIKADEPISDEKVDKILEVLADAAPAQIVAAIEQLLTTNITSDQAVSIASSPEVLAAVTEEQAVAIFEEIVVDQLTTEQADELVAVLNEAPTKVKKAFQETINVFAGVFDSFQMVGQTIPVGERRTLLAVSNTLVAVGASLRRKEK